MIARVTEAVAHVLERTFLPQLARAARFFFHTAPYELKIMCTAILFAIHEFVIKVYGAIAAFISEMIFFISGRASIEASKSLFDALRLDYLIAIGVIIVSLSVLMVCILFPLIYKQLTRPRLKVFISFNRTREDIAEDLHKQLEKASAKVSRIPFLENAEHQTILANTQQFIKDCNMFICLPGSASSFVDNEVFSATTSGKPITFLISENSGTLPNTADKRYPVFRLEATIEAQYKPLIEFVSYVGADLESTRKLCRHALRDPFMQTSNALALTIGAISLVPLWAYCFARVVLRAFSVGQSVQLAHFALLVLLVSGAVISFLYSALFLRDLAKQFGARNRARLKTIAAQFNRDDWIGAIPDLCPGAKMYECLFECAPSAHHEATRRPAEQERAQQMQHTNTLSPVVKDPTLALQKFWRTI
jgi:hypothetical protein